MSKTSENFVLENFAAITKRVPHHPTNSSLKCLEALNFSLGKYSTCSETNTSPSVIIEEA